MTLHAYFACFFIPLTIVYIITGILYLFDITGGVKQEFEYHIGLEESFALTEDFSLTKGFSLSKKSAKSLAIKTLKENSHPPLPEDYYPEEDLHDWYGFKQEVIVIPEIESSSVKIIVKEHDVLHQLLLIHKGHAGWIFMWLGVLFGLSLLFSLVSGVLLVFQLPKMKTQAIYITLAGFVLLIVFFIKG